MRRLFTLLAVLLLVAAACGDDADEATSPSSTVAPATTIAAPTTTIAPTTTAAPTTTTAAPTTAAAVDDGFPVTVVAGDREVTIAERPTRIVSLSSTHTEVLYALGAGDQVAATDLTSNFPAAANDTPKLDSFNFNVEEVAALDPDLVIIAFDFQGEGEQLDAVGIPYLLLGPPADLGGMLEQIGMVGQITGRVDEGEALASDLAARIADLEDRAGPVTGLTFFHEVDETLFSTTSGSFLGDVYATLGLVNIADEVGGGNPFPQLSSEYIIEQDPSLVFLGDAAFGVTPESLLDRPGWAALTAVSAGNVFALDADISGRWGPRIVDLMELILEAAGSAVS